jgi:hypothetical protein
MSNIRGSVTVIDLVRLPPEIVILMVDAFADASCGNHHRSTASENVNNTLFILTSAARREQPYGNDAASSYNVNGVAVKRGI